MIGMYQLVCHPATPAGAVKQIEVGIERSAADRLHLDYAIRGDIGRVRHEPAGPPARADDLWTGTCCELFVRPGRGEAYYEFNFAPSGKWAAYQFKDYRNAMRNVSSLSEPEIVVQRAEHALYLHVTLETGAWSREHHRADWRAALSVVVEECTGDKSYWALAHPSATPDFHHKDSFTCRLPRPS